jgi:hypothetical protein
LHLPRYTETHDYANPATAIPFGNHEFMFLAAALIGSTVMYGGVAGIL